MALDLSKLTAEITRMTTIKDGVLALIASLKAASGDPVALQAAVDAITSNDNALAAAVAANTTPTPPTP
jgi:hypothetical protein